LTASGRAYGRGSTLAFAARNFLPIFAILFPRRSNDQLRG
jgi:hypothetical protein